MQPMQQVTKKCSQNRPKGSKNRAQDAQDAAKIASWSPHGRQNASQDAPKTAKKVQFFSFFGGFWCKMLTSAPQDIPVRADIAQNSSQDASSRSSNPPKTSKNLKKQMVFQCFLKCSPCNKYPKNAPKIDPKAPKIEPKMQPRWPLGAQTIHHTIKTMPQPINNIIKTIP